MEYIIEYLQDEYQYDYVKAVLDNLGDDPDCVADMLDILGIPRDLVSKLLKQPSSSLAEPQEYVLPPISFPPTEPRTKRVSLIEPEIKESIVKQYCYVPATTNTSNISPIGSQNENQSKVRYHNNQIVTNKGEKYVDMLKKKT